MIQTFCTRLGLSSTDSATLVAFGRVYASARHAAFKRVHVLGQDENTVRKGVQREFGIPYRIANSIIYDNKQAVESCRGVLEWRRGNLEQVVANLRDDLAKLPDRDSAAQRRRAHFLLRDIGKVEATLRRVEADLAAAIPKICFGGRSLLRKGSVEAWRFRRVRNILFVGKAQDKGGNGMATYDPVRAELRVRLPDAVGGKGDARWLVLRNVRFRHGQDAVARALALGHPLTWRIFHDNGAWRAHVTVDLPAADVLTRDRCGMIGVDLNTDHIAVTVTTADGNLRRVLSFPFPPDGTRSVHAREIIQESVKGLVALALHLRLPIAVEDLDFRKKKNGLKKVSIEHRKRLSSFAYAAFSAAIASRCGRLGVRLITVNPAYTSVIGREKYMRGRGLSVHHAAALVIARAAQGFTERGVTMQGGRGGVSVRTTRPGPAPAQPRVRVVRSGSRKARKPALKRDRLTRGVTSSPSEERRAVCAAPPGIGERSGVGANVVMGLSDGPPGLGGKPSEIPDVTYRKRLMMSG